MKRRITIGILAIALLVLGLVGTHILIRWHVSCVLIRELMWLEGAHQWLREDPDLAEANLELAIVEQHLLIERHLQNPMSRCPERFPAQFDPVKVWQMLSTRSWEPNVHAKYLHFLDQIGVPHSNAYDTVIQRNIAAIKRFAERKKTTQPSPGPYPRKAADGLPVNDQE